MKAGFPMTALAIVLLVAGLVLVVSGAELFFSGLLATAERFGVSPFVITVVLSGFELENLAAGIAANANGLPGAAAGTFLGGTTFLALGVAGLGSLIAPMQAELPRAGLAWTAAAPLPLLVLALDGELSRLDGGLLIGWFVVALWGLARTGRSMVGGELPARRRPMLRLTAGVALLTGGGELLGEGLREVVARLGVSQTLLGNTVIAASVEAEELARVVVPAKRGRGDIAIGNIVGTLVHFVGFNAGVIALVKPLTLDAATQQLHLPVAVGSTLLLAGLLAARRGIGRLDGGFLVAGYVGYLVIAVVVALGGPW